MTAITSQTVANEFIKLAKRRGKELTPMQILKLVYLAHGWTLGYTDKPLISDKIEAWKYGPVIPALYETIRAYGRAPIPFPIPASQNEYLTDEQKFMIRRVYNTYKDMDGLQLSNLTHKNGTPWDSTYNNKTNDSDEMPTDIIRAFYQKKIRENNTATTGA